MVGHIGIVACSAPGAALCYSTICAEAPALLGRHAHPEISLHTYSFADHVALLEREDWAGLAAMLGSSAAKLASIGAEFLICPDNTAHQALDAITEPMPIPWLHIVEPVVAAATRLGIERIGVLGTRYLMEGPVYAGRLADAGLECRVPPPRQRDVVNDIIFGELVNGDATEPSQRALATIIGDLERQQGCEAIILGCTELPLAISEETCPLPLLDSTRLLARAALRRAVEASAAQ